MDKNILKNKVPTQLQKVGIGFVKLRTHSKSPFEKSWQNSPYSYQTIKPWIDQGNNYGVHGGYADLIIIDADNKEMVQVVESKLPRTFTVKSPLKGAHFYYFCKDIKKTTVLKKDGAQFGEIRSKGSQVVGPGSVHPDTGSEYLIVNDSEIKEVSAELILSELYEYIPLDVPDTTTEIGDIRIADVLNHNNIQYQTNGNRLVCSHPVHGSTNNNNFNVDLAQNVWHCFRCGSGGGPLSLIAVLEKIIDCAQAIKGGLTGDKFKETVKVAREKYGYDIRAEGDIRDFLDDRRPRSFSTKKIVDEIIRQHTLIFALEEFFEYAEGCYRKVGETVIKKWIMRLLGGDLSKPKTEEALFFLKPAVQIQDECLNSGNYLNVKNGLYDLKTGEIFAHTPKVYSTIQLDVAYNPEAKCNLWIKTLREIFPGEGGAQKINTVQEFFGLCLTKETKYEKVLVCIGEGGNGKSVVLWVLQHLLKKENVSAIPLEKFDNHHYLISLFGKLANISTEANARSDVYDSTFKAIVSGDLIQADQKFKAAVHFNPFCKLVIATNNLPRVDDKSDAFFRRLLILRFNVKFAETEQNKNLKYELLSELDGILIWSLEGLRRLEARGYFETSTEMQQEIDDYRIDNNNVILFVNEDCILSPDETIPIGNLYDRYVEWCKYNGCPHQKKIRFGKELLRQFKEIGKQTAANGVWVWRGISHQG